MRFKRIHIELTNQCNFSCEFCPQILMRRPFAEMGLSLLAKIIDQIAQDKLTDTIFFHLMGEPLLYKNIAQAIKFAKAKGLKVCLTTNGWLMTGIMIENILASGVDHIIFSVQTPDQETFKLRNANVDFESYQDRISSCIAIILEYPKKIKVTLSFLVTPFKEIILPSKKFKTIENKKQLVSYFFKWLKRITEHPQDKNGVLFKIDSNMNRIEKRLKKMSLLGWNLLKITNYFMLETRVMGDWVHPGLLSENIKKAKFGSCEGLTKHLGILSNGSIVFCCVDFDGKTSFANINDSTIKEALNQEQILKIVNGFKRNRIIHPYCQMCLGDISWQRSFVRQLGSIIYFGIYRRLWAKNRAKQVPVIEELIDIS